MAYPKVLVGCPTSDYHRYCWEEYKNSVKSLIYNNFDIVLVDNSKDNDYYKSLVDDKIKVLRCSYSENPMDRIVRSRNMLRDFALSEGYDYLLSLEQDVIAPNDILARLMARKKDIVSGVYFGRYIRNRQKRILPMLWVLRKGDGTKQEYVPVDTKYINSNKLLKVDICGLGCLLISKKVLEKVKFRYDVSVRKQFDDVYFCVDAKNNGYQIYADSSVKCKHLVSQRPWSWNKLLE